MDVKGIIWVGAATDDRERSTRFFADVLGMPVVTCKAAQKLKLEPLSLRTASARVTASTSGCPSNARK